MKKNAFTLVELLVVISIIAMLTSIVLVSLRGVRAKGRDARRMSDIRQIANAMELAYDDSSSNCGGENAYPRATSTAVLSNVFSKICPGTGGGDYLNPTPKDPVNSSPYQYMVMANVGACGPNLPAGQWYCIYAALESETGYVVASQRGVKKISTQPTDCNCGW